MTRRGKLGEFEAPWHVQMTVFCLLVMSSLILMSDVASARSWVKIRNNIGPGQRMWVACYYTLMDSGYKKPATINFGETYYIRFYRIRLVKTRWWCNFEWENTHRNQTFSVWDHNPGNTMPVGCSQCFWDARTDGWYAWDKVSQNFKFYEPWLLPASLPSPVALTDDVHSESQINMSGSALIAISIRSCVISAINHGSNCS